MIGYRNDRCAARGTGRAWAVVALCFVACSGDGRSGTTDATVVHADAGPNPGSMQPNHEGPLELLVSVESADGTVCRGECTTLSAHVEGATAALHYRWGHDEAGEASSEVCPVQTTSFEVSVEEESSGQSEFVTGGRKATDQLTITVHDCAPRPNDPILCELRRRFDALEERGPLGAMKPWASFGLGEDSLLDSDPEGNVVVVGLFSGRVDFGAGELKATSAVNGLVMKLDANCQVLWSRALPAPVTTDAYLPLAMRVDNAGNTLIAGIAGPVFNLDFLTRRTLSFGTELIVEKLDGRGERVYRTHYQAGPGGFVSSLDVDPQGNVYVAGITHAFSNLGSGPIGISPTTLHSYLLGLNARGERTFLRTDTGIYRVAATDRQLIADRGNWAQLDPLRTLAGVAFADTTAPELAALSPSDGVEQWKRAKDKSVNGLAALHSGRFLSLVNEGGGYEDAMGLYVTSARGELIMHDATGASVRTTSLFQREERSTGPTVDPFVHALTLNPRLTALSVGADEGVALAGTVGMAAEVLGTQLMPATQSDVLVAKLDADGNALWARTLSWGSHSSTSGVALAPDGSVFVAGSAQVDAPTGEFDLVLTRLRAEP